MGTTQVVPGVSPEAAARIRSFYRDTPPVDQEQLQRDHPPPFKEIRISATRAWAVRRRAPQRRDSRRTSTVRHSPGRSAVKASSTASRDDGGGGEPPGPPPSAEPHGRGDEQHGGDLNGWDHLAQLIYGDLVAGAA